MWTDCSSALADQIHNGSSLFATDVSTPKTLLRRIDRLALTFEVHSDRSVCATHISTSRTALRSIVSRPSPNSFATIRAFSRPTSAHRKPCLAMRSLSLTVATHSDPSVRTADISASDAPQPRTDLLALTDRTHSKPTLLAAAMPTSKPYTSGRHRARNRAKNPRHPPVCPKSPNLPRARVPLRFDAAAHRQKAQRFESLQRRPIHTRGRRPRPRQHDSSSKRRQPSQIAERGYYRETRLPLARIRSLVPICRHSSHITSYSNTPTLKLRPRHFSPQNRRPPAPLGYA